MNIVKKSIIWNCCQKIKNIFPNLKEESDIITKKHEIINTTITYEELLENISNLRNGKKIEDIWYAIYNYYKNQNEYYEKLQQNLEGIDYTNLPKNIDKNIIEEINKTP